MTTFIKSKAAKAVVGLLAIVALAVAIQAQASYTFTQNLSLGKTSAEAMEVQKFLNANGFLVSQTGAGSPGLESNYFGSKTASAVASFQAAKGLSVGAYAGYWGPTTRAAANAMDGGSMTLPAGCTSTSGFSTTSGLPCSGGSTTLPAGCTSLIGYSPTTGLSCSGGSVPSQTGSVTASLSTTNPASGVIVAGQATAKLLDIAFTGSGTVNSVMLKRTGISDQSTLTSVYLYDGVNRLTDGYSFNNTGDITINNLGLVVSGSRTISVVADVYASAPSGQTIAVALTNFTSGTTASTVNVQGNTMSVASGSTLASISMSGSNTVTGTPTVNAGTSSYAVWRQAFQVNTRTLWLKAANFRITGSAPSGALTNVGLYIDGVKAPMNAAMTMANGSNYLSFDLSSAPLALTTGSHTFEVRGDISTGASFSFSVSLQQASDIMVMDPQVGVNVAVSSFTASTGATITIGAGSATIVTDPTFNSTTNVTGGASNVVIAKYKIHGYGEDVKVTSLPITPVLVNACTSGATYNSAPCNVTTAGATHTKFATGNGLQNVTLYFNGSQVGSQQSWGSGALTFNLGSQMIIPAGVDSTLEVRADLRTSPASAGADDSTATSGANYTAGTVSANLGAGTAEGWSSHSSYTTPTTTGHTVAIQTGLLGVAKNIGYASQSQNPNTAGVKIGSFLLQNSSTSESVRVTGLTVGLLDAPSGNVLTTGTTPALTNFGGLRTSENLNYQIQPQGSNVFSVDFTIPSGSTRTVDIFADTNSETSVNVVTTLVVSALGSSSNVSISQNGNGTAVEGQTIALGSGTVGTPALLTGSATSAQYIAAGGAGATDATVASYNFVSTGGAAIINELKFNVTGTGTVTSIKVGNVSAPVFSGVAWLQGLNLAVPNGGSGLQVTAYVSYAPVGTGGIAPATTSVVGLDYVKYTSGGTTAELTSLAVNAPTMIMVGSKPTVSVNTSVNTGLILAAENKIGEVTVSADAKGNIKINDIKFAVGASNFDTYPTYTGARIADGSTTIAGSSCGQGTAAAASQTIFCEFGTVGNTFTTTTGTGSVEINTDFDGYTIAAGTSKTFNLFATVNGVPTASTTPGISTSVNAAGFNWDDASYAVFAGDAVVASPSAGTNLTGTDIYNFPTGSYTLRQ